MYGEAIIELGAIDGESPLFKYVFVLMLPVIVGIVYVLASKNAARKRTILPFTLLAFSAVVLLVFVGDGRFSGKPLYFGAMVLALIANSVYVTYLLRFCEECGTTTARIGQAPWRCQDCQTKRGTL